MCGCHVVDNGYEYVVADVYSRVVAAAAVARAGARTGAEAEAAAELPEWRAHRWRAREHLWRSGCVDDYLNTLVSAVVLLLLVGQYRETIIGRGLPVIASPDDGFPISPLPDARLAVRNRSSGHPFMGNIGHRGGSISGRVSSGGVNIGNGSIGAD